MSYENSVENYMQHNLGALTHISYVALLAVAFELITLSISVVNQCHFMDKGSKIVLLKK